MEVKIADSESLAALLLKKVLPSLLIAGLILGLIYSVYQRGYASGSRDVQAKWDQDKLAVEAAYDALNVQLAKQEETHRLKQEGIANELAETRKGYEATLRNQRIDFDQRLLQSARRAEVYRRDAEAGAAACRDLAGHAARLDRALEEGRVLVGGLATTLGFREFQLRQLGEQILADRQLCAGDR